MKRDLLFILEKLVSVMDENRVEMLARQHGIRQKRDGAAHTQNHKESSLIIPLSRGSNPPFLVLISKIA